MPRRPRASTPGVVYHLISRLVDRRWFIATELERTCYLDLLGRALATTDWRCLAYAVMSNHVHLAVMAGEQPLAGWVRRVHSPFADWMNRAHDRIGSVFVRGPKDFAIAPASVGRLIAYLHNNPVRANLVAAADDSSWTSHRAYRRPSTAPSWLHVATGLALSGFSVPKDFDEWVTDSRQHSAEDTKPFSRHDNEAGLAGIVLPRAPRARRTLGCPDPRDLVAATAGELGLSVPQLCSSRRGRSERIAREVVVRCGERYGLTGTEIAAALRLTQQGVSAIWLREPVARPDVLDLCTRVVRRLGTAPSPQVVEVVTDPVPQVVQLVTDP